MQQSKSMALILSSQAIILVVCNMQLIFGLIPFLLFRSAYLSAKRLWDAFPVPAGERCSSSSVKIRLLVCTMTSPQLCGMYTENCLHLFFLLHLQQTRGHWCLFPSACSILLFGTEMLNLTESAGIRGNVPELEGDRVMGLPAGHTCLSLLRQAFLDPPYVPPAAGRPHPYICKYWIFTEWYQLIKTVPHGSIRRNSANKHAT